MSGGRWSRGVAVLATVVAVALAGCSGDESTVGPRQESATGGGGHTGGVRAPAPAPQPRDEAAEGDVEASPSRAVDPSRDPLSTFALDIDTASYGYARRRLDDGTLPDRSAVRAEEFVNALDHGYAEPEADGFAVHVDGTTTPWTGPDERIVRIGLQTRSRSASSRPEAALTFVVDVSGSMGEPGRLDLVRDALHHLVDELRPDDAVALVTFESVANLVTPMTPVRDRGRLHEAVDELRAGGSTNLEAGLVLGYRVAREGWRPHASNRVVLLSDALANTGSTRADSILERVREEAGRGIALLGVGVGSEYGDTLMEQLADGGDGFTAYVRERDEARRLFVDRLPATLEVRALDAKAQVQFDPKAVASYRLIGFDNRAVADERFRDDTVDGGEVGPGHSVTVLYAVRLRPGADQSDLGRVTVRWLDPRTRRPQEVEQVVGTTRLARAFDDAASSLRASVVAAALAESLRGAGVVSAADVAAVARRVAERDDGADVAELARLAGRAAELGGS